MPKFLPLKRIFVVGTLLIQLTPALQYSAPLSQKQKQGNLPTGTNNVREWRPGTYLGLTAGKSTRADVLRVLGEPKRLDAPPDQSTEEPEVWYLYDNKSGEFAGEITVVIDKRTDVVLGIDLNPDSLSREDAVRLLGSDYIITRYDFDDCLGNEESAPMYESPNGQLLEIEYRQRGIAMSISGNGKVDTISYVSKPIGTRESRCRRPIIRKQRKRSKQNKQTVKPLTSPQLFLLAF